MEARLKNTLSKEFITTVTKYKELYANIYGFSYKADNILEKEMDKIYGNKDRRPYMNEIIKKAVINPHTQDECLQILKTECEELDVIINVRDIIE